MSREIEFKGNNVEKAADIASKKLDISREDLKYRVISYGSTGIFGLVGTKKAKISVVLPDAENEAKRKTDKESATIEKASPSRPHTANGKTDDKDITTNASEAEEDLSSIVDPKSLGMEVLRRITSLFSGDTRVSVEDSQEQLVFRIDSSDAAVMIGKRGMTLEAIQYLTEKVINKHNKKRIRIQVDIEGYLEKRKASLEALASRMADKAERTRKPVTLGQMNAYERRIIHIALKEDPRIRTQSKGDGFLRKLVIFPERKYSKKKSNNNR